MLGSDSILFENLLNFSEVEKALVKQRSKKEKDKKSKKKGVNKDNASGRDDGGTNKKNKVDSKARKSKTSTLKRLANSLNPPGLPPEPPARPPVREQLANEEIQRKYSDAVLPQNPVMADMIKELGEKSSSLNRPHNVVTELSSSDVHQKAEQAPKSVQNDWHKRPPAPLPLEVQQDRIQEKRCPSLTANEGGARKLSLPLLPQQDQQNLLPCPPSQDLQKLLPAPPTQSLRKPPALQPPTQQKPVPNPLPPTIQQKEPPTAGSQQKPLSTPLPPHAYSKQSSSLLLKEHKQKDQKMQQKPPTLPHAPKQQTPAPSCDDEAVAVQKDEEDHWLKETKPVGNTAKPHAVRRKSADSTNQEANVSRSPVPRPRNRPPPPPVPLQESGKSASNSSLSSGDVCLSESSGDGLGPSTKPRPLPRPRHRGEKQEPSAGSHPTAENNHESELLQVKPVISSAQAGSESQFTKQPSVKRKPTHPPPSVPSSDISVAAPHQKIILSGPKPSPAGPKPVVTRPKPKPLAKPNLPRKPGVAPTSLESEVNLSPQASKIFTVSQQGLTKVREIISLTNARVMDDSQNSLFSIIKDLGKISLEVVESFSSLTDSLGPQARFRARRTVTDLESKYSDLDSLVQTVNQNPTAVEMELIGKAVNSLGCALDSICIVLKTTSY